MSSRSPRAADDVALADEARARQDNPGGAFRSVDHALRWYFEARERMQSPHALWPRTETHPDTGEEVRVQVDGGRGGDLDGVHATLATIHAVLEELRREEPQQFAVLVRHLRDGKSITAIGQEVGLATATVSGLHWRGHAYLRGRLRGEGVVR